MTIDKAPSAELLDRYNRLLEYFRSLKSVAVAFSSGVDSTFLLHAATEALGDNVLAITACASSFPARELDEARDYCAKRNIRHKLYQFDEFAIEGFASNPKNRCYLCKRELFHKIIEIAKSDNINKIVEGSNLDDNGDYRPGLQAVAELGILSPLREVGFTKEDIRILLKYFGIATWSKQSFACLATRFVYNEPITADKLAMVDKAEQLLLDIGFNQLRVRVHGNMARIEVMPEEFDKLIAPEMRTKITSNFKEFGFDYVTMDLIGYRTGSMNEVLKVGEH